MRLAATAGFQVKNTVLVTSRKQPGKYRDDSLKNTGFPEKLIHLGVLPVMGTTPGGKDKTGKKPG